MEKVVISVKELSEQMGISLPMAYQLTDEPGFPLVRVGRRRLIPVDSLKKWLEENSANGRNCGGLGKCPNCGDSSDSKPHGNRNGIDGWDARGAQGVQSTENGQDRTDGYKQSQHKREG